MNTRILDLPVSRKILCGSVLYYGHANVRRGVVGGGGNANPHQNPTLALSLLAPQFRHGDKTLGVRLGKQIRRWKS